MFPLDIVKTRLQNSRAGSGALYASPADCFRKVVRLEGARGLYRGLGANLVGVTPEKAIKLAMNDTMREVLSAADGSITLPCEVLAGATAGFTQVVATNPMEIVKIRMQMQGAPGGERQSTLQVVRQLGLRGLYRGTPATLMRDVPFSIIFFPTYSNVRAMFADETGRVPVPGTLLAGAVAGASAAGLMTPADVIKTRLQSKGGDALYRGIGHCFQTILREEGARALYKGAEMRMLVQAPLFGIALLAFEMQKKWMMRARTPSS